MAAGTSELTKVDSAVSGISSSPTEKKHPVGGHRRTSSSVTGVFNINDLEKEGTEIKLAPETQKLNWKLNTSPGTLDEKDVLKKYLCTPPVKKIDLHFPLGLEVTARNLKGVTIKDALDAIHKQFKKKADDELEDPILAGFEWDREECYTRFIVHQKKESSAPVSKKAKKKGEA
ncbi:MAG: hypothetical protein M1831_006975 [Alyxoria varia]|nr:MAG: hypothetical protein M1831_006975 [Alyxoria varia]